MSDSGDSDVSWVFYKDRPDWSDITPVPEDDGPTPVVVIAHSEKFEDVYDYFRAILQKNEKSERALHLTKDAVELNPANYTVWQYRRDVLKDLDADLRSELDYVEFVIKQSPKNYQVWHHRRVLVEWLQDPTLELELTGDALMQDPKNYHAWQHRQWAMKTFGLFDKEMEFVDKLITDDVRNNSAWNQRYFVMNNHLGWSDLNVQKEILYTLEKIKFVKNNESAWNYLRGVLLHDKRGLGGNAVVLSFCEDLFKNRCRSPFLMAFIIDICDEAIQKCETTSCLYNAERAIQLAESLATKYDKIRSKYWNYISEKFKKIQRMENDCFSRSYRPRFMCTLERTARAMVSQLQSSLFFMTSIKLGLREHTEHLLEFLLAFFDFLLALQTKRDEMLKVKSHDSYSTEPIELRALKQQLANNSCKCKLCSTNKSLSLEDGSSCYDKEVQVTNSKVSFYRCPQDDVLNLHTTKQSKASSLTKNIFCPGCYMAMNLLRNKGTKILKDEESETKPEMFSSDKSTERIIKFAEKTTSMAIINSLLTPKFSDTTFSDMASEYSTDMSMATTKSHKRKVDKVTFKNIPREQELVVPLFSRNCLCMENFINSIRPPLLDDAIH